MPADDSFRELNKSSIADVKNTGGRLGGTITAGLFIENFVANNVPWIHLDIAGTAYFTQKRKNIFQKVLLEYMLKHCIIY